MGPWDEPTVTEVSTHCVSIDEPTVTEVSVGPRDEPTVTEVSVGSWDVPTITEVSTQCGSRGLYRQTWVIT